MTKSKLALWPDTTYITSTYDGPYMRVFGNGDVLISNDSGMAYYSTMKHEVPMLGGDIYRLVHGVTF